MARQGPKGGSGAGRANPEDLTSESEAQAVAGGSSLSLTKSEGGFLRHAFTQEGWVMPSILLR